MADFEYVASLLVESGDVEGVRAWIGSHQQGKRTIDIQLTSYNKINNNQTTITHQ